MSVERSHRHAHMDRRTVLSTVSVGLATGLAGCSEPTTDATTTITTPSPSASTLQIRVENGTGPPTTYAVGYAYRPPERTPSTCSRSRSSNRGRPEPQTRGRSTPASTNCRSPSHSGVRRFGGRATSAPRNWSSSALPRLGSRSPTGVRRVSDSRSTGFPPAMIEERRPLLRPPSVLPWNR